MARRTGVTVLKIAITALAFAWLFVVVDRRAVASSLARVTLVAFAGAVALTLLGVFVGTLRWRALLAAYGAPNRPSIARLFRLYLVGTFYNTWLPGAVAGDVVRGVATNESFGADGTVSAVAVVLIERVLGLVGLLAITATVVLLHPLHQDSRVLYASLAGIALAFSLIALVSAGYRIGPRIGGTLGQRIASLPRIQSAAPFALAILLSLFTQILVPLSAHLFMNVIDPHVALTDTLAVFPIVTAAAYFPFSVNGAGVRETAAAYLFEAVGVARGDAVAVSLLVWCAQAAVGALGGLLQLAPAKEKSAP
ncbi:MAG: flippase-like domain-containing protein [Sandaracinaceae bacterium]|nr:flippase-like domain-containing protein [Sandaracinaceae bacterium]